MSRHDRPVTRDSLLATPEMAIRVPGEIELSRGGSDEGEGRGFDNADMSAEGRRVIAVPESGSALLSLLVRELTTLGWVHQGDGWDAAVLRRDADETFIARVDRDRGSSRMADLIDDPSAKAIQVGAEAQWFAGAPPEWTVVTMFYLVTSID